MYCWGKWAVKVEERIATPARAGVCIGLKCSVMPRPLQQSLSQNDTAAMDDEDALHDAFSTSHLWKSSTYFEDPTSYDTCLFGPLKLDRMSRRVSFLRRVE